MAGQKAASDVVSGRFVKPIVPDMFVQFRDPRIKRSRELPSEPVGSDILDGFFHDNFRPEVASDVLSAGCRV